MVRHAKRVQYPREGGLGVVAAVISVAASDNLCPKATVTDETLFAGRPVKHAVGVRARCGDLQAYDDACLSIRVLRALGSVGKCDDGDAVWL